MLSTGHEQISERLSRAFGPQRNLVVMFSSWVRTADIARVEASAEKDLVKSIDELSRAVSVLKKGMSFCTRTQGAEED